MMKCEKSSRVVQWTYPLLMNSSDKETGQGPHGSSSTCHLIDSSLNYPN